MKCPICLHSTKIYNSRGSKTTFETWRRHRCTNCAFTFTTRETIDWNGSISVETSDKILPYSYSRLLSSVLSAVSRCEAPTDAAVDLANTIEQQLVLNGFFKNKVQKSSQIINVSITVLSRYDTNLAVHYANVVYDGKPPQNVLKAILEL